MALQPVGSGSSIASGASASHAKFAHKTDVVRVYADGCTATVAVGNTAVASATDFIVPANHEPLTINIGRPSAQRVVGVTTTDTTVIVDFPEGTGSPFAVGSRVDLTVTGQSYYDDAVGFATVSKVWSGSGRNGYFSTRITVDADTSGIVTAYSSDNYAELRNSFKVSALAKGGAATGKSTLYYQQVQISGEG